MQTMLLSAQVLVSQQSWVSVVLIPQSSTQFLVCEPATQIPQSPQTLFVPGTQLVHSESNEHSLPFPVSEQACPFSQNFGVVQSAFELQVGKFNETVETVQVEPLSLIHI